MDGGVANFASNARISNNSFQDPCTKYSSFYVTLSKTKTKTIVQVLVLVLVLVGLNRTKTKTRTKIRNCTFSWKMKYLEEKMLFE